MGREGRSKAALTWPVASQNIDLAVKWLPKKKKWLINRAVDLFKRFSMLMNLNLGL